MALDVLALTLVCVAAGFGAARGAFAGAVGLAALLGAWAAGLLAGPALGPGLATAGDLPPAVGSALAATLAFAFFRVALGLLGRWLRRLEERRVGLARSALDRIGGGCLGAVRGGLLAVMLVWLALWVDALRVVGFAPGLPELGASHAAAATAAAVEVGTLAFVGDDATGRFVAQLAARPATSLGELDRLLADPQVLELRDDALFWDGVERGDVDAALARASFVRLARAPGPRRQLRALGLIAAPAAEDPAAFGDAMAEVARELGPRLRALREDPELAQLMQDPEVVAMLQSGDHVALLAHPAFRAAVARAIGDVAPEGFASAQPQPSLRPRVRP